MPTSKSYTATQINTAIDTDLADNTTKLITPAKLRSVLKKLNAKGNGSTTISSTPITTSLVDTIASGSVILSDIKAGDTLNGLLLTEGMVVAILGQADATENGIYVIGANAGETVRHDDFPDVESCLDVTITANTPDSIIGSVTVMKDDGASGVKSKPIATETTLEITDATIISYLIDVDNYTDGVYDNPDDIGLEHGYWYVDWVNQIKYEIVKIGADLRVLKFKINNLV